MKGLLLVVSGPSGAGKGTICQRLRQICPELCLSVSVTTRLPRVGEIDGKSYFFHTRQEFDDMLAHDALIEHAEVYGQCYGTPRQFVEDCIDKGTDVLLEIDPQGAMQVKEKFAQGVFVFVVPPSLKELENRLHQRGSETPQSLKQRLSAAASELDYMPEYDYVVINDDIETAASTINAIIQAERCKVDRNQCLLAQLKGESL